MLASESNGNLEKGGKVGLERSLRDQTKTVEDNIIHDSEDNRLGRIVRVRLGSGCGKSHFLLEAPKILNAHGIYIAYNLDQDLQHDENEPKGSILLRILLRLATVPNARCPDFFRTDEGKSLLSLKTDVLRSFVVHQLGKLEKEIFIGVDEVMELKNVARIGSILSELVLLNATIIIIIDGAMFLSHRCTENPLLRQVKEISFAGRPKFLMKLLLN